ncbi:MAG TPA: ABC transporter permease [Terriglobales bacterium]|nr:ABC transporter permease [Terriglobales bacterium]
MKARSLLRDIFSSRSVDRGVKQEIRSRNQRLGNWFQGFFSDCRFALRQLRKSPAFTTVIVLTLALGIGANTAVFSILDAVLIRPLPYPNPKRLVKAGTYDLKSGEFYGTTSYPDFIDWSEQNHFFEHLAAYEAKPFNLAGTLQPEHVKGDVVSSDFFETLGIQPDQGRSLASAQNRQAVVLSHSLWSRSFTSDPHAIGKSITLDGYSYEVIGVMPRGFQFPDPETELWVSITPVRPDLREEIVARGNMEISVIGRLNANIDLSQAQAGMAVVASGLARKYPDSNRDLGVRLVPLQEDIVGKFRLALLILMGSAALVLLIACANIGTLLLARATARRSEIVIRSSLGATRRRIIVQLLTESVLLAAAGGTLGVLLAFLLMDVLVAGAPKDIPRISAAHINLMVLIFTGLISLLAGVAFGLAPAWQISRGDPGETLKHTAQTLERRTPMTRVMVATELSLSLMLLTAAGLLGKSLVLLSHVDPGFRSDHLLTLEVPRSMTDSEDARRTWTDFYQQLLARIQALPGVESAGATLSLPFRGRSWNVSFRVAGHPYASWTDQPWAEARIVSNNYFEVMKIPLRRGRYFSEHDTKDSPHVAVINETVARLYWPDQDPVGQFIQMPAFGTGHCQVVGIVADIRQTDLSEEPPPGIYLPYTQERMPWQTLVVRTKNDPMGFAAIIRHEISVLDPEQPIARVATLDRLLEASTNQERFRTFLIGSFAGIALLLSAVGIYGVMAYTVNRRTAEIGVRMALGARPVDILKLILGESMTLTLLGVSFGLIGAYSVLRIMKSLLFGVTSTDPFTFASVTLILCFVAFLASYIPAHRAAHTDSMVTLRYE